jgi:nitrite reductase/ring-hydroxylating ferredoxin subunit
VGWGHDLFEEAPVRELKILKPIAKLENAAFLDPLVKPISKAVLALAKPRVVEDLLHGTPVGHPVHPILVLVPTGAWFSVGTLDLLPGNEAAARTLVALGVLSAAPTAVTGYADWSRSQVQQQRVGIVHQAANITAVALYTWSWVERGRGNLTRGKVLGFLGLGAVTAGGYLGGHLSYRLSSGANHTESVPHRFPAGWQPLAALDEIPERTLVRREVAGQPLLVYRRGTGVRVLSNVCSHLSGPLDEGKLIEGDEPCVQCPWHQSVFSLDTGDAVHGPATSPQPAFAVRVASGQVEIMLPNADG